jgi:hypothetical protein
VKACNRHIVETLQISEDMIRLAESGDRDREDAGCGVLYGVLLDSAYKIKKIAEEEKKRHREKGAWREDF